MTIKYTYADVKDILVTLLKKELPKYNFSDVKVIKADPQSPAEIPCIGINRIDDNESDGSISDSRQTLYDPATEELKTFYGTFFQEAMEVRIWHTNADMREKLYLHTKVILFAARTELVEKGILNVLLRSGRDEQDTTQAQAPMAIYWSSITLSYLNPMDVELESSVAPITSITNVINQDAVEEEDSNE